jgi:hypothetical protein
MSIDIGVEESDKGGEGGREWLASHTIEQLVVLSSFVL